MVHLDQGNHWDHLVHLVVVLASCGDQVVQLASLGDQGDLGGVVVVFPSLELVSCHAVVCLVWVAFLS